MGLDVKEEELAADLNRLSFSEAATPEAPAEIKAIVALITDYNNAFQQKHGRGGTAKDHVSIRQNSKFGDWDIVIEEDCPAFEYIEEQMRLRTMGGIAQDRTHRDGWTRVFYNYRVSVRPEDLTRFRHSIESGIAKLSNDGLNGAKQTGFRKDLA